MADSPSESDPRSRHLLDFLSDKWVPVVLFYLDRGKKRPSELGNLLDGVSRKVLTQTLREMEARGVVVRTVFPEVPPRVEYELTDTGRELAQLLGYVCGWADAHSEAMQQMALVTSMPSKA